MSRADASRGSWHRQRPWWIPSPPPRGGAPRARTRRVGARVLSRVRALALVALAGLSAPGCWAHDRPSASAADSRAAQPAVRLLPPTSGRYVITREGEPAGEEVFTVTSSAGLWRAEGTIHLRQPVEQTERYRLDLDLHTHEPLGFEVVLELEGERERAVGRREGDYLVVDGETLAGRWTRRVPYGRGTEVELGTPLSSTLVLSLLGPTLEPKKPVLVRSVAITPPTLDPAVSVVAYELHDRVGDTSRIVRGSPSHGDRTALWVRPDGLPIRVRTGDPAYELRLVE